MLMDAKTAGGEPALAADLPAALGAFRRAMRRVLGTGSLFGPLTGAQAELVRLVRHQPGVSVTAAATELRLAANTVSTLVRQLSEAGLLVREPDPADRRVARLRLTGRTRAEVRRWQDRQAQVVAEALEWLPERHVRALSEALPALAALTEQLALIEPPAPAGPPRVGPAPTGRPGGSA
jgi:DNA-binding MarR family transcriptional regulator